jgi:hypothetical protein
MAQQDKVRNFRIKGKLCGKKFKEATVRLFSIFGGVSIYNNGAMVLHHHVKHTF